MMRISLLIICLFFVYSTQAEVYKSVDENGNVVFTDKPGPDSEKVEVKEISVIEGPKHEPFEYTPRNKKDEDGQGYKKLEITSPENDTAVRDNSGNVSVSVAIEPALNIEAGDKLVLYMDGGKAAEGVTTQFNVQNVDRGTHTFNVAVVDNGGKELKRSSTISFTIQRYFEPPPDAGAGPAN